MGDTGSTAESESQDPTLDFISIKNSFVHFKESGAGKDMDPRSIQSMPNGKFGECLKSDVSAAAEAAQIDCRKRRPASLSLSNDEDAEIETCSSILFPATPNAD